LDPFTGARRNLSPDLPDIYNAPDGPHWQGFGETAYDPTLNEVVYLQGGKDGSTSPIHFVLWDTKTSRSLASFQIVGDLETVPRWSPDGKAFAFAPSLFEKASQWPSYELMIVGRDGKFEQVTNLASYYPWVYISDLRWSPDGSKIAFWFSAFNQKPDFVSNAPQQLAVLDLTSRQVTNYCVPGHHADAIGAVRRNEAPLWSPDGDQIIIQNRYSEDHSRVILVDLAKGIAAQVAEDMEPVGWMVAP
jgi:Tol biopolymer transport system component